MVNEIQEAKWEYLLDPCFELSNSAGKPLTNGWIEVYIAGSRDKYYCASDFSGTLHPFQIPLDSLGSNIVLASPDNSYDVYVYNQYGSLIMSRYNVKCHGGGSGSSTYVGDRLYYGQFKATDVATQAGLTRVKGNIDVDDGKLELKQDMSYHITLRGEFVVNDVSNVDTVLSYIEYSAVKPINVNVDYTKDGSQYFEISYDIYRLAEDMDYPVSFLQSNGLVKNLVVEVHSLSNLATTASGEGSEYEPGWGIVIQNNVISVDPSILEDFTTTEEVMAIVSGITGVGPGEVYNAGDYISIEDNTISVTGIDPNNYVTYEFLDAAIASAVSGLDDGTLVISVGVIEAAADNTEVWDEIARLVDSNKYGVFVRHPNYENAAGLLWRGTRPETHDTLYHTLFLDYYGNGTATVRGEWVRGVTYRETRSDVKYLSQVYHDGTLTGSGTMSDQLKVNHQFVPYFEDLNIATVTAIQVATGAIPEMPEEEEVEFEEINLDDYALVSAIPDVSDFVTHEELIEAVSAVTGLGEYGQFYCAACTGTAELGKVKGTLSVTNDGKVSLKKGCSYHVTVRGGIEVDPAANTYGAFGLTEFITGNSINSNIDRTIEDTQYFEISYDLYNLSADTDYQFAFTNVGGSVNALYVEIHEIGHVGSGSGGAVTGTAEYDAGWGINIVNNVISVDPNVIPEQVQSDWAEIASALPSFIKNKPNLDVYSTHEEVYEATVTAINYVTGIIPEAQVQSDWDQNNDSEPDYIKNKPSIPSIEGLATVEQVSAVSGYLQNEINNIPGQVQSDWAQDDSNQVDYIKNKPDEYDLVAGQNVSISVSGTNVVISSTGGSGGGGSSYTAGTGIDITNDVISVDNTVALKTDIPDVSNFTTHTEVYSATVTAVQVATGAIPELPDEEEVQFEEINLNDYALASAIPTIELDGDNQVTAIDGHALAGGSSADSDTFTAEVYATSQQWGYSANTSMSTPYADVLNAYGQGKKLVVKFNVYNGSAYEFRTLLNLSNVTNDATHFNFCDRIDNMSILHVEYWGANDILTYTSGAQADWNASLNGEAGYIKNKPSIPEIELNSDSQVTAIDGHTLAGGGDSYMEGFGIDISNNEISIDPSIVALASADPNIFFAHVKATNTSYSSTTEYTPYADVKAAYDAGKIIYCVLHTPLNWIYAVLPLVSAANHDSAQSSGNLSLIFTAYSPEIWKKVYVVEYDGMMRTVWLRAYDSQADWNQQYSNHPNYIKNKPSIPEIELNDDSQVTAIDGHTLAGTGGSSYTAGTGIDITSDVISIDNTVALKTDIPSTASFATKAELTSVSGTLQTEIEAVSGIIPELPDEEEVEFEEFNLSDYALASAIPTLQLDGNNQVTAIDGHTLAGTGGSSYTAGTGIDITSDVISIDNTVALKSDVTAVDTKINTVSGLITPELPVVAGTGIGITETVTEITIAVTGNYATQSDIPDTSDMATKTWVGNQGYLTSVPNTYATKTYVDNSVTGLQTKLTGINDVQVVASLPANPTSNTLYLIPEV